MINVTKTIFHYWNLWLSKIVSWDLSPPSFKLTFETLMLFVALINSWHFCILCITHIFILKTVVMATRNFKNNILQKIMYLFANICMLENYYVFNFITVDYLNNWWKFDLKQVISALTYMRNVLVIELCKWEENSD